MNVNEAHWQWVQPAADQRPPPKPRTAPRTNSAAVASLVFGILWIWWIGSVLALVFGYQALRQIDWAAEWDGGSESGRGLAVAGIVLGWIGVGTFSLLVLIFAAGSS